MKSETLLYQTLVKSTKKDEWLQILKKVICQGWPERQCDVPLEVMPFWDFHDELSSYNGFIYREERTVIPLELVIIKGSSRANKKSVSYHNMSHKRQYKYLSSSEQRCLKVNSKHVIQCLCLYYTGNYWESRSRQLPFFQDSSISRWQPICFNIYGNLHCILDEIVSPFQRIALVYFKGFLHIFNEKLYHTIWKYNVNEIN